MKKIFPFLFLLPAFIQAQNITNTLGSNGTFVVEDNSNNDVLLINPASPVQEYVFGLQPSLFSISSNLPVGKFSFISGLLPTSVNLVTAGNAPSNGNFFQMFRQRGTLISPLVLLAGDEIGTINFGAYNNPGWAGFLSSINSDIVTVSGTSPALYSTRLIFRTTQTNGLTQNTMTFNNGGNLTISGLSGTGNALLVGNSNGTLVRSGLTIDNNGNLTVPGSINATTVSTDAIKTVTTGPQTLTLSDQVLICTTATMTINLPDATTCKGKRYTVKKGSTSNITLTLDGFGTQLIDGGQIYAIGGGSNYQYVTIISDGTQWWIIARGQGT